MQNLEENTESVRSPGTAGFKRVLSLWDLVLFGLAFVGPVAPYSMFGIASVQSQGHLPLVYLLAMGVMCLTAISYGRMAAAYPEAGSTYAYASRGLHPYLGFLAGWGMILDYMLTPLLSVIYVALTANKLVPQVPYGLWAVLTGIGITLINLRGIRVTARANLALNAIMIGSLVWFVLVALHALLNGVGEGTLFSTKPFYSPAHFAWKPILGATSLAALSYLGFDGISTLSEEAKNPGKDIWRATVLVCFLAGGLFVLQSYLGQMVWPDYTAFKPVETAFMDIGQRIGGSPLYLCISLVLVVGGLASAITGQASASRLLVGMGRDSLLPKRFFAHIHPRLGTPVYSVILMGSIHLAGAFILRYTEAAELVNFGALLGFMLVNLAVVRHFFFRLQRRAIGSNLVIPLAAFAICLCLWVNLSGLALKLGAAWLTVGVLYLLVLTRGFRKSLVSIRFE